MALSAPRVLALCAGYGGLELGIKLALPAAAAVWYVEREAHAAAVLVARMEVLGVAPIWSDLRTFDGRDWRGAVDIVAAGYPCRGESNAGPRSGTDHEAWLWPQVWRIVREVGPRYVFLENVAAHLGRSFRDVVSDLAQGGWRVEWDCVPAAAVGAPHIRDRVFVLASNPDREPVRLVAKRHQLDASERGDAVSGESRPPWATTDAHGGGCDESGMQSLGNAEIIRDGQARPSADAHRDDGGQGGPERSLRDGRPDAVVDGARWSFPDTSGVRCPGWRAGPGRKERDETVGSGDQRDASNPDSAGLEGAVSLSRGRDRSSDGGASDDPDAQRDGREGEPTSWLHAGGECGDDSDGLGAGDRGLCREPWVIRPMPEPTLCRVADGPARQLDVCLRSLRNGRLYVAGNGVVPQAAAKAFETLWKRIHEQ